MFPSTVREPCASWLRSGDGHGKILVFPRDERMRADVAARLRAQEIDAVRYYIATIMAEHGFVSVPNMAIDQPFSIGAPAQATVPVAAR